MAASTITWMVLVRDVSHAMKVKGESVIIAALVLDVDTGLVRGLSVAPIEETALAQAFEIALKKPAGTLPPGRPDRVLVPVGLADLVEGELGKLGRNRPIPPVSEVQPGTEAEDIFDSFVGHMAGRIQSTDPPTPADWALLFGRMFAYYEAEPWLRWSDEVDLEIEIDLDGESVKNTAVVMGNSGFQSGLALYPGKAIRADLEKWKPGTPWPLEPGTLACTLDPWGEAPVELAARAARYGWPTEADLLPAFFALGSKQGGEFGREDAQRFAIATAAVVAHDARGPVPVNGQSETTTGTVDLAESRRAEFSIRHTPPPED